MSIKLVNKNDRSYLNILQIQKVFIVLTVIQQPLLLNEDNNVHSLTQSIFLFIPTVYFRKF